IANLADLLLYLDQGSGDAGQSMQEHHARVLAYRQRYGVNDKG
ncbi:MAG: orotate phosphoribosyltransferase, partial [Comamonas sp.]